MKRQTEGQSRGKMRFFTPELYIRGNSSDDAEADRAEEEWEQQIRRYQKYLAKHAGEMNERVRALAQSLSLHDAEFLAIQEDLVDPSPLRPLLAPLVATISVRQGANITNIVYFLWSHVEEAWPDESRWPFSKLRTHWLYDEVEVERDSRPWPLYWHRVLSSDGRVISIPFFDVIVQSFSTKKPETKLITRKGA